MLRGWRCCEDGAAKTMVSREVGLKRVGSFIALGACTRELGGRRTRLYMPFVRARELGTPASSKGRIHASEPSRWSQSGAPLLQRKRPSALRGSLRIRTMSSIRTDGGPRGRTPSYAIFRRRVLSMVRTMMGAYRVRAHLPPKSGSSLCRHNPLLISTSPLARCVMLVPSENNGLDFCARARYNASLAVRFSNAYMTGTTSSSTPQRTPSIPVSRQCPGRSTANGLTSTNRPEGVLRHLCLPTAPSYGHSQVPYIRPVWP